MRAFFLALICGISPIYAAAPVISNPSAVQRQNTDLIDITYDVAAVTSTVSVSLQVSSDSGSTFAIPVTMLNGAIGSGVQTGTGRKITWDAGKDWSGQYSAQIRFKIIADDGNILAPTGFAPIPAGDFAMGNSMAADTDIKDAPTRTVYLDAFYMGKYEVTKAEWDDVRIWGLSNGYTDLEGSTAKSADHPIHSTSWYQIVKWCNARSQKEGLTPAYYTDSTHNTIYKTGNVDVTNAQVKWNANGYRLPTEAEWEKAARGGLSGKRFPWGDTISHSQANYTAYSGYSYDLSGAVNQFHPTYAVGADPLTSPVGSFTANGYGLYDMAGNMFEWCWDWYGTYASDSQINPRGPEIGTVRVFRGGSWYYNADDCRTAFRSIFPPTHTGFNVGFRVMRRSGVNNIAAATTGNVTIDTRPRPPSITSQPLATQILNAGSAATLSVSASGTALTYQWYQGARLDTSNPVGGNSSSFTTPSLATNSSYWVRVSNAGGSVDSSESVIVVWTQGIRVGDQFSANLGPLVNGGKTLKLVGKLPSGLSLNTKTWQVSGTVTGNAGNFTSSIQVIQNKAVLQTISIPISIGNFPTSLIGNYEALLKGQNGAPFGVFKLTTGKNVWTASLETLGQARRTAKGTFVLQKGSDSASLEAKFAATKTAPAIALNFTLDGGSPFLFGTHGAGALEGFKMIDSLTSATNPILYNLIMDQGTVDALDKPAGKGWASGSFTKTGSGFFKGMLGDATACSFPLRLSVTGQAILWAQPYANKNSFIGGVVELVDLVPNANNYEALEPRVSWVKVADPKTLSYPGGFSFDDLPVSGSSWLIPATHTALGNSLGWLGGEKCTVRIYGAGLSNDWQSGTVKLPTEFTLDKAFKLVAPVNASTVKWSGNVVKGTGGFSGSFILPAGLAANTIAGAGASSGLLLQDDKWGITTGLGLMKVPISGTKGSFRTAALTLEQYSAVPVGFVLIPQGAFTMGNSVAEDTDITDAPTRTVYLDAFYMGKYEVTKAEWDDVRIWGLSNGYTFLWSGSGKASNHPVQQVCWYDIVLWCNARSQKEGLTPVYYTDDAQTTIYKTNKAGVGPGELDVTNIQVKWSANGYRLPTEAEWEKAARGGLSGNRFPWGDTINHSQANYQSTLSLYDYDTSGLVYSYHPTYATESMPYTAPLGAFAANGYGLYNMAGNVSELCWDLYGTYAAGSQTNPRVSSSDTQYRICRGGSWNNFAGHSRVALRSFIGPNSASFNLGFRVARSLTP